MEARSSVLSQQNPGGFTEYFVVSDQTHPIFESENVLHCCARCDQACPASGIDEDSGLCRDCILVSELQMLQDDGGDVARKTKLYREYAAKRSFPWLLSDAEACMLMQQPCVFCGQSRGQTNCIARLNCQVKAYVLENSVTACSVCNMIRLDYSVDDFVRICRHVASHRGLVPDKHFHPEAFRNSPTVKTFKQYANNTNRIMMLDKPTFEVLLIGDCTYCGKKSVPVMLF